MLFRLSSPFALPLTHLPAGMDVTRSPTRNGCRNHTSGRTSSRLLDSALDIRMIDRMMVLLLGVLTVTDLPTDHDRHLMMLGAYGLALRH